MSDRDLGLIPSRLGGGAHTRGGWGGSYTVWGGDSGLDCSD